MYGIVFKEVKPLDFGGPLTVAALKSGQIQVGELFSTSVYDPDFVVLTDDKHLESADNITPIVRTAVATDDVKTLLNGGEREAHDRRDAGAQQAGRHRPQGPGGRGHDLPAAAGPAGSRPPPREPATRSRSGSRARSARARSSPRCTRRSSRTPGTRSSAQLDLESRKVSDAALFSGKIDVKPEYLASEAAAQDPNAAVSGDPANNAQILTRLLTAKQVTVLDYSNAIDTNVFVVTKETADADHLANVSDLAKPAP